MSDNGQSQNLHLGEFVALMAFLMSLVALSIDAMLPALPAIGADLGVTRANDNQLIVSLLMLGMALGQVFYGPLSDSVGRKPAVYAGIALFAAGCLLSIFATDLTVMLVGRLLQGLGIAGPRVVTVAMVRDQFAGRAMARVMSFVMAIFILMPMIAPALGQGVLLLANWQIIFVLFVVLALAAALWLALRQRETLAPAQRRPFSLSGIARAFVEVCRNRRAIGYTIAAGFISGPFIGYLSSSQQILQQQYELGQMFAVVFGLLALAIGGASLINGMLVMRFGMRRLAMIALTVSTLTSFVFLGYAAFEDGLPPFWSLMLYLSVVFFAVGMLFGNINALAMEPLGHIAGVGAAVVGGLSTLIAIPLGILIGHGFNGTVLPLVGGFAVFASLSILAMLWTDRGRTPVG